jgi:beta-glucanase (GH16 family)
VDIYEAIGEEPNLMYGVIHRSQYDSQKEFFSAWVSDERILNSYILTFQWTEDALTWYMDGELIGSITKDIPTIPMYMICNLAVGGSWAGSPSDLDFPEVYEIEILEFSPVEIFSR